MKLALAAGRGEAEVLRQPDITYPHARKIHIWIGGFGGETAGFVSPGVVCNILELLDLKISSRKHLISYRHLISHRYFCRAQHLISYRH